MNISGASPRATPSRRHVPAMTSGTSSSVDDTDQETLAVCGLLLRCGEDVADVGVDAVVGIEAVAAFDEDVEFCLE